MASLRIEAPSAAAAFVLVDLLASLGPRAEGTSRGGWAIVVPLDDSADGTVSECLARTQEWLDLCSLPSTLVTMAGQTHVLSNRVPAAAQ